MSVGQSVWYLSLFQSVFSYLISFTEGGGFSLSPLLTVIRPVGVPVPLLGLPLVPRSLSGLCS